MGMEIGLLAGLLMLNLFFELFPSASLGRLSTRTFDSALEAIDAFLPYDASVEEKQEAVEEQQAVLVEQVEEMIQEVTPNVVMSLSADTVGLSTVGTVAASLPSSDPAPGEIGPPVFMPVEVFPVCTYMPAPAYPEMARMAGVEGIATLWIYVDARGVVQEVQLMQTSGVSSLDTAAMAAARNTRWNPARNNNVSVGVWTTLRYNFSLSN